MIKHKLKIIFLISGSFLTSTDASSFLIDLEETPLGTYRPHQRPSITSLPEHVILEMTPVKNQGPLGTCVSFAVSGCGEFHYKSRGLKFSEAEFTVLAETHLPQEFGGNCKPGLNLGQALKIGQNYGFVTEDKLPYGAYLRYVASKNKINLKSPNWYNDLTNTPTPIICNRLKYGSSKDSYNTTMMEMRVNLQLSEALSDVGYPLPYVYPIHHVSRSSLTQTRAGSFLQTLFGQSTQETCIGTACNADVEWVKHALAIGHPVAAALPVFGRKVNGQTITNWNHDQLIQSQTRFPQIQSPRQEDHIIGYHAVILSGFNDRNRTFRVKNSWGTDWGYQGKADIPYDYIKRYATELLGVGK
ncbi:MAG: C1 family peptidase [Bacteriovoracaceae bacterium]|nr:C1 family peptidase [Bacteriovoracaceae bacterium]